MHNFMVSRSVNYDQIIIIDFKKNIQSMRIPLNFLTKSENSWTNFTSKSLSLSKKKKKKKRRRFDRSNEEDTRNGGPEKTKYRGRRKKGLDRKWKIREKGEEWIVENRQRGLVRRVGPRAFPRFREAYRTTALRFASLIPSPGRTTLEGQLSMLIQHYIRLQVYAYTYRTWWTCTHIHLLIQGDSQVRTWQGWRVNK